MGATVTKIWKVRVGEVEHDVQLRHHSFTGQREVLVDGQVVLQKRKFLDDGDEL